MQRADARREEQAQYANSLPFAHGRGDHVLCLAPDEDRRRREAYSITLFRFSRLTLMNEWWFVNKQGFGRIRPQQAQPDRPGKLLLNARSRAKKNDCRK